MADMLLAGNRSRFKALVDKHIKEGMNLRDATGAAAFESFVWQPIEKGAEGGLTAAILSLKGTHQNNADLKANQALAISDFSGARGGGGQRLLPGAPVNAAALSEAGTHGLPGTSGLSGLPYVLSVPGLPSLPSAPTLLSLPSVPGLPGTAGTLNAEGQGLGTRQMPERMLDNIDSMEKIGDNNVKSKYGTEELNQEYQISINKALDNIKIRNRVEKTAKEVNDWWNAKGYESPYQTGSPVYEIELAETERFVRVFSDNSNMAGGWIMKAEDIEGLTAEQIKDKYALPTLPKYVCDVIIEAGNMIRCGITGPQEKYSGNGGGIQFDLMQQYIGVFTNKRLLP